MRQKPVDTNHTPKPKAVEATKRTNDEQRMPEVENESARQRNAEAPRPQVGEKLADFKKRERAAQPGQ